MKENQVERYLKAQKKVENIKKFYSHLKVYLVVNIILMFLAYKAMDFVGRDAFHDQGFIDWYLWNIIGTPVLWGVGLLAHALYVFRFQSKPLKMPKPKFLKDWEQRQISKYIEEEEFKNHSN